MKFNKIKSYAIQYWIFYLIGFAVILGLKYYYSRAGSDELTWILAPTAGWVRILSGITFEYEPHVGYVNHYFRFIIAPSCSGIQFMIIAIATLIYSFVHRMGTAKKGFCWLGLSLGASYLLTVFVNGFRIVISIYLPLYLQKTDIYAGWLTPEKLHTTIGTVVYFTSLFTIYHIAGYVSRKIADMPEKELNCIPPVFWYFSIVLGIPFLNRAYEKDGTKFAEYAMLMTAVCLTIIFLFCSLSMIRKYIVKRRK